jgi:hypothetical protein
MVESQAYLGDPSQPGFIASEVFSQPQADIEDPLNRRLRISLSRYSLEDQPLGNNFMYISRLLAIRIGCQQTDILDFRRVDHNGSTDAVFEVKVSSAFYARRTQEELQSEQQPFYNYNVSQYPVSSYGFSFSTYHYSNIAVTDNKIQVSTEKETKSTLTLVTKPKRSVKL